MAGRFGIPDRIFIVFNSPRFRGIFAGNLSLKINKNVNKFNIGVVKRINELFFFISDFFRSYFFLFFLLSCEKTGENLFLGPFERLH
jgi:hypothetical protein